MLTRATNIIPHHGIQHVDSRRDPMERQLGFDRAVVYTAGVRGAEIAIPGLRAQEAEARRDRLAELGGEIVRASEAGGEWRPRGRSRR